MINGLSAMYQPVRSLDPNHPDLVTVTNTPITTPTSTTGIPNGAPGVPAAVPGTAPQPQPQIPTIPPMPGGLDGGRVVTPQELVANQLASLLDGNSAYIQNARRRGAEYSNSRGLLNSSIGAGASQRAAIEAGLPIASQDAATFTNANNATYGSYDNLRSQYTQAQLSRQNSMFEAQQADWLSNQAFTRNFNGQLAMLPIQNAADMWAGLMQMAATDPSVFTPNVLAGYQDFFQSGFDEYISRYLTPATGAGG